MRNIDEIRNGITETDKALAKLFEERMNLSKEIAEYKKQNGLEIEDKAREEKVISEGESYVKEEYKEYFKEFLKENIALSKRIQREEIFKESNRIIINSQSGEYSVTVERGAIKNLNRYFNLDRKVLIVTDSEVPEIYSKTVKKQCKAGEIFTFACGEESKTLDTYTEIIKVLTNGGYCRYDCIVAVGGGVVGDIAGFAAATYMRGIDFYNLPTTLLSQVDASIGGKTAVNFCDCKNQIGAFYPPKAVVIDVDTLKTLDARQISNGLFESVKMAACFDSQLFSLFESGDVYGNIEEIIIRSLKIKKAVVEKDEKESGYRKALNFGHTVGHAIESNRKDLYHGECIALGMLYFSSEEVRRRLKAVYRKLDFFTGNTVPCKQLSDTVSHDKKKSGDKIDVVTVEQIGGFKTESISFEKLCKIIESGEER